MVWYNGNRLFDITGIHNTLLYTILNYNYGMSGDYTKNTIESMKPCNHQVIIITCLKLASLIIKVNL